MTIQTNLKNEISLSFENIFNYHRLNVEIDCRDTYKIFFQNPIINNKSIFVKKQLKFLDSFNFESVKFALNLQRTNASKKM